MESKHTICGIYANSTCSVVVGNLIPHESTEVAEPVLQITGSVVLKKVQNLVLEPSSVQYKLSICKTHASQVLQSMDSMFQKHPLLFLVLDSCIQCFWIHGFNVLETATLQCNLCSCILSVLEMAPHVNKHILQILPNICAMYTLEHSCSSGLLNAGSIVVACPFQSIG